MLELPSFAFKDLLYPTDEVIARLRKICDTCGFFTISDHPVPSVLLDNVRSAAFSFFQLPSEVKERYGHENQVVTPKACRGYTCQELLNKEDGHDGKELFDLGIEKPLLPGAIFSGPTTMPPDDVAPGFKTSLYDLQKIVLGSLVPTVGRAFALALEQDIQFFDEHLRDPTLIQRVNYYPPGSSAGRHTDSALFTLLFQDVTAEGEDPSLQVFTSDGKWVDVPGKQGELVVNLGDTFQFWTNGRFVSTPHKVKHKSNSPRISLPFFVSPDIDSAFTPFGTSNGEKVRVRDIIVKYYKNLWVHGKGAGRAAELS